MLSLPRRRRGVRISADGTALVQAAANEMGMGTATAQIQHAAERLGLPIEQGVVSVRRFEPARLADGGRLVPDREHCRGGAGGDREGASQLLDARAAPMPTRRWRARPTTQIDARAGGCLAPTMPTRAITYASILQRAEQDYVEAERRPARRGS